ncbi:MAG: hypothetical protein V4665_00025 [Patescibacteria group bacterium]
MEIMNIKRIRLLRAVTVRGRNIFGMPAWITFTPTGGHGWYLQDTHTNALAPINKTLIRCGKNTLYARNRSTTIHELEHIMSLRWFGLDCVSITGSHWPPAYSTEEYWMHFCTSDLILSKEEDNIPVFDIIGAHKHYSNLKGMVRGTHIGAAPKTYPGFGEISIEVFIDYKGIGRNTKFYDLESFASVAGTYPQGYPFYRYYACKAFSLIGWPHMKRVVWPQKYKKEKTLNLFADHRALDIFGALAMIHHRMLPGNFHFSSICSGHLYDMHAIKNIPV